MSDHAALRAEAVDLLAEWESIHQCEDMVDAIFGLVARHVGALAAPAVLVITPNVKTDVYVSRDAVWALLTGGQE